MQRNWKDIPGYSGKYQVNIMGDVQRTYLSGKTKLLTPYHKKMSGSQRLIVKLTKDEKSREVILMQIVANTFLGPCPDGFVAYHKNGDQLDNCVNNIGYISRAELGRLTGAKSNRQPVAKIDCTGTVVAFYSSARAAAKENYLSYQTVNDRCNGKCKSAFASDGFAYAWEDSEVSMRRAIRKIELENGYMPEALKVAFDF